MKIRHLSGSTLLCVGWSLLVVTEFSLGDDQAGLNGTDGIGLFRRFNNRRHEASVQARSITTRKHFTKAKTNATGACSTVTCPGRKQCQEKNGNTRCTCKLPCSRNQRRGGPVCGSDGRTYSSKCALYRANCRATDSVIHFGHSGSCFVIPRYHQSNETDRRAVNKFVRSQDSRVSGLPRKFPFKAQSIINHYAATDEKQEKGTCHTLTCPRKKVCRERKGRARCTCKITCSPITRRIGPVCGSDGRTYRTLCQLYRKNCKMEDTDIYYKQPSSCEEDSKNYGNKPVRVYTKNDLPADFIVPTPPPGSLEELAFRAPEHLKSALISKVLRFRVLQTLHGRRV